MMTRNSIFRALKPSFSESRDEQHLLVWGELGQWLFVDDELLTLIRSLDGKKPLKNVLKRHAKQFKKDRNTVEQEASQVLAQLFERGIIIPKGSKPKSVASEPLSVANITVNLTNRCNLKCSFCYNSRRKTEEIPADQLMDVLEASKDIIEDDAAFIILGGEPFLTPDRLFTILKRADQIFRPKTLVSTNGTLLSPEKIEELSNHRVEVQVSIDSHDPAKHNAIRGDGVWEKAVEAIKNLVEANIYTVMSMVYDKRSFRDIEPYFDLALSLGVNEARLIPMRLIGGGYDQRDLCPDQFEVFEHLLDVIEARPEFRPLLGRDFFSIITAICRTSAQRISCGIGRRVLFVDADGKVYPCPNHIHPDLIGGDLRKDSLAEILKKSPVFQEIRDQYQVGRYQKCKECPFRHWCAGDCRGEVLAVSGDPLAPSPHCEELLKIYPRMLWLIAENDSRIGLQDSLSSARKAKNAFL